MADQLKESFHLQFKMPVFSMLHFLIFLICVNCLLFSQVAIVSKQIQNRLLNFNSYLNLLLNQPFGKLKAILTFNYYFLWDVAII